MQMENKFTLLIIIWHRLRNMFYKIINIFIKSEGIIFLLIMFFLR
jgi:hypothetical protein